MMCPARDRRPATAGTHSSLSAPCRRTQTAPTRSCASRTTQSEVRVCRPLASLRIACHVATSARPSPRTNAQAWQVPVQPRTLQHRLPPTRLPRQHRRPTRLRRRRLPPRPTRSPQQPPPPPQQTRLQTLAHLPQPSRRASLAEGAQGGGESLDRASGTKRTMTMFLSESHQYFAPKTW